MNLSIETAVRMGLLIGQFAFGFIGVMLLIQLLPRRKPRWLHLTALRWRSNPVPDRWLRLLRISRHHPSFKERELLLSGCGYTADAGWYAAGRRLLLLVLLCAAAILLLLPIQQEGLVLFYAALLAAFAAVYWDLPWARSIGKLRAYRITKEIYMMSNQLLYLAQSSLHIHTKLMRCAPFTRTLRGDLERMLAEWYHDSEQALRTFKQRVGTDDGMSFVETIDSLRLHESEAYYDLLRERIQDYKDKLELAKESRKESTSYLLFVIAGVPILYTFQIFIYPWVMEGQKLFESLG